ncbi:hypothetical protein AB1Y20_001396 [Prymnesium parvum]|uniref:COX assembly mitochondrial protein n=1 Tax=Prymnesium parvum TaxID=97485 RepID=A0AB34K8K9_PRYPA
MAPKLQQFNTANFTLHEHCGGFSIALQQCLQKHGLPNDPMSLDDSAWSRAEDCHRIWTVYRECGREFIDSVKSVRCAHEVNLFHRCTKDCEQVEADALRCLGTKIKLRMSLSGKSCESVPSI